MERTICLLARAHLADFTRSVWSMVNNCIVERQSRQAKMVDFEHAAVLDDATANMEFQSLVSELQEDIGRGGPARPLIL